MKNSNWPSTQMTLLSRLRELDDDAGWSDFWKLYSPLIYGFCRYRQLQHEDALDVSQNVLIALRQSLPKFDPIKGKFRGWFCQIIRREIYGFLDKQHHRATGDSSFPDRAAPIESDELDLEFVRYVVQLAVDQLKAELEPVECIVLDEVVVKGRKPRNVVQEIQRDAAWISRTKYLLMQRLKEEVYFLTDGELE